MLKISEKWLREWVSPDASVEEIAEQLTNAGLEVESVYRVGFPSTSVVVGEIREVTNHASIDGLFVCNVDDGSNIHQVVCGAPNTRVGLKTALVQVGGVIADGRQVSKQKIGGVESAGMLCSSAELGVGADAGRLLEFTADEVVGSSLSEMDQFDDTVIELDLTPNRGDCFCIRGVAREVALSNKLDFTDFSVEPVAATHAYEIPIQLADPTGCPRYLGRIIKNIDPEATTPDWMVQRLQNAGLRPVSPVVDVTNYVMLELGQPLHAFDLDLVRSGIVVRKAKGGEKLVLLDGQEVDLTPEVLLITDGTQPVAVAGVMGGEKSGIQATTKDIFVECAYFNPLSILGTARSFGIQTDASTRYERGVDYELQHRAMEQVTRLLLSIVGGEPGPVTDACADSYLPVPNEVQITFESMDRLIGESIDREEITDIFNRIGLKPRVGSDGWVTTSPSHRFDIQIKEDLIEEVVRVYGYNTVRSTNPVTKLRITDQLADTRTQHDLKHLLSQLGYFEAITYSFIDPSLNELFFPNIEAIGLVNPIAEDKASMRKSLIPGLLSSLRYNLDREQEIVRLFESGMCFRQLGNELQQDNYLSGVATGTLRPENWAAKSSTLDFYDIKGDLESLGESLGVEFDFASSVDFPSFLHPRQAALVSLDSTSIGYIGRLHPKIEREFKIPAVFAFELEVQSLLNRSQKTLRSISQYPAMRRDLAMLVDENVVAAEIEQLARLQLGDLLEKFTLFDLYTGEGIEKGKKSVAIGLTLRDPKKTLAEQRVNQLVDDLVQEFNGQLGAVQR